MASLRDQLLRIQRENYEKNLRQVKRNLGNNPIVARYGRDYARYLKSYQGISSKAELLRRVLAMADSMGYDVLAALEYEFFLFNETPDSIRQKNYRNLQTLTPGFFGYSVLRNTVHAELYQDFLQLCETMDFPLECLHTETGPGVIEAAITYDHASLAADKAILFKTFVKVWAQRRAMMATFMAKWSNNFPGQSGHIHLSLRRKSENLGSWRRA